MEIYPSGSDVRRSRDKIGMNEPTMFVDYAEARVQVARVREGGKVG
jgi:hypothetical protein